MSGPGNGRRWDSEYRGGKYAFLHRPRERVRLAAVAAMIDRSIEANGASEIVDIGCGEGLLLAQLAGLSVTRYIGLDISAVALAKLPQSTIPVACVCSSLEAWDGDPPAQARRILVASEVLYYSGAAVADLVRIVRASPQVREVVVSAVAGRADKPNWEAASRKLWHDLAQTGWRVAERQAVEDGGTGTVWNLARFDVEARASP